MASIAGLVIADALGTRRGIVDTESLNRLRIVGAVVGATPVGVIVSDFMAQREAASAVLPVVVAPQVTVQVPDVSERDAEAAKQVLEGLGLTGVVGESVVSMSVAKDRVVSQRPVAGELVASGSIVTLRLSKGFPMPNCVGFSCSDAQAQLTTLGLGFSLTQEPTDPAQVDKIVRQAPEPDVFVSLGQKVTLFCGTQRSTAAQTVKA
jgi:serine/threonine-protein kinase